jgi:hypothetical protein
MALALISGKTHVGRAAGPFGCPGGYPIKIENGEIALNLPAGVTPEEAIAFNKKFEEWKASISTRHHGV